MTERQARAVAAEVPDPEIPVLTIADLGVLRDVTVETDGHVHVTITPTYSGCPAMDAIRDDIVQALSERGAPGVSVHTTLSPAWTTDWITEHGRRKLHDYGVAPPGPSQEGHHRGRAPVAVTLSVRCPRCGSTDTREISRFGSTACKAIHACNSCLEPFDRFKTL